MYGLSENTIRETRSVLRRHRGVREAVILGTRALGREQVSSDVDLALRGYVDDIEAERIALELEELPVPVRFDVQAESFIRHAPLKEHIARSGQVLYSREERSPVHGTDSAA